MEKIKVCYILSFYDEGTDTHLFYNYLLIKELKKREVDLVVLDVKSLGVSGLFLKLIPLRFRGYKNCYVHYSFYGGMFAWLTGYKVFYWNRGMPWLFKRSWLEEKIFKFILRHTILVTGPESLAKEYQKRYGVKEYRVLSNWVDVERFRPSLPRNEVLQGHAYPAAAGLLCSSRHGGTAQGLAKLIPSANEDACVVLFIHHLSKRKGADLVPEIAKGFGPPAGGDVLFLMIGDGPEFKNCKLKIENSKLNNVRLLGKVPNSEIVKYFWASDIFLMPSREEGSPHVLLEAMASGTPFVASDVGGVRELAPHGAEEFLCESEDIKCFQDKIKTLLSDKELYNKARAAGLEHAKNFDISRGVEEFTKLFI